VIFDAEEGSDVVREGIVVNGVDVGSGEEGI
jgi:hypothetical protein